jgi:hypothetical protein
VAWRTRTCSRGLDGPPASSQTSAVKKINPFDRTSVKTHKVTSNLDEVGRLPADHNARPNFALGQRRNAALISRAAGQQVVLSGNARASADRLNMLFADLASDPGSGPPGSIASADFQNGTYDYGSHAFSDFLVENLDWGPFSGAVTPGEGLVEPVNSAAGPALAAPLTAQVLAAGGFTVAINWLAPDPVGASVSQIYVALADAPAYAHFWDAIFNHYNPGDGTGHDFGFDSPAGSGTRAAVIGAGEHRAAITFDTTGIHCSIDGGAVLGVDDPLDLNLVNLIGFSYSGCTWRALEFYPAKANSDLPALAVLA